MSLAHTTSTNQPLVSTSYTYDVLGNRLTRTDTPSVTPPPATTDPNTWNYDVANRLLTRPGVTYTYDNNGNTLTKTDSSGTTTYGYDYENRLTSVGAPGGMTASYAYDPFGRRISKTVNGVVTRYLYDGMNIIKEYDGTGTLLATYVHGPGIDEPLAMTRGGQTVYYHADGLRSITGLTNSSQTVVQNYGYDGFGNLTQAPTIQNPYTYTGREWDAETGLYYYRARYYDPKVGRFITQDPIGFTGGDFNLYAYVGNNPVGFIDPLGLWRNPGSIFNEAKNDANSKFSKKDRWNGPGDAYRHCLASCMMTKENGLFLTWLFGGLNEMYGDWAHNQEQGERCMDESNNATGAGLGNNGNCQSSCMQATINGILQTYTSGTTSGYWQ